VPCDVWEALEMHESIIRYSGITSGIYEEMEVFDDEFNVEPSMGNKESSRKKHWTFIKKQDRRHARLPVLAIDFLTILCSIDDITGYTEKNE